MIACNYTNVQTMVMVFMSLAFFGKGFGALGWTVIADTSPKELVGVNGGVFNLFGNLSTITTPMDHWNSGGETDGVVQPCADFHGDDARWWRSSATW